MDANTDATDNKNYLRHACGFCNTNHHDRCAIVIKNGVHGLVWCPCGCQPSMDPDNVERAMARTTGRGTPATAIPTTPTRGDINPEDQVLPEGPTTRTTPRPARTTSSTRPDCKCGCGQTTGGGNYRPGHDSKHLSALAGKVKTGEITADQARQELPSDSLRAKLTNRLK